MKNMLNINKKRYVKGFVKSAFTDFKNNWKKLIVMMLIIFVVSYSYGFIVDNTTLTIAQQVISTFLSIAFLKVVLNIIDRKEISVKQIITGITLKQFLIILVASILMTLLVAIGLVLLIVPGIIFAIALSLAAYAVLDKNKGVVSSLKYSWRITKGYRFKMFILGIISMLLTILGVITFGIGMIVVIPVVYLMQARLYRELSSNEGLENCDCSGEEVCEIHDDFKDQENHADADIEMNKESESKIESNQEEKES